MQSMMLVWFAVGLLVATAPMPRQITRVSQDEASFSPDGARIVFISAADGPANIFVMDTSGRHIVRLTRSSL